MFSCTRAGCPFEAPEGGDDHFWEEIASGTDTTPGVGSMTPELSLEYRSTTRDGPLGIEFSLGGTAPPIRRCRAVGVEVVVQVSSPAGHPVAASKEASRRVVARRMSKTYDDRPRGPT